MYLCIGANLYTCLSKGIAKKRYQSSQLSGTLIKKRERYQQQICHQYCLDHSTVQLCSTDSFIAILVLFSPKIEQLQSSKFAGELGSGSQSSNCNVRLSQTFNYLHKVYIYIKLAISYSNEKETLMHRYYFRPQCHFFSSVNKSRHLIFNSLFFHHYCQALSN